MERLNIEEVPPPPRRVPSWRRFTPLTTKNLVTIVGGTMITLVVVFFVLWMGLFLLSEHIEKKCAPMNPVNEMECRMILSDLRKEHENLTLHDDNSTQSFIDNFDFFNSTCLQEDYCWMNNIETDREIRFMSIFQQGAQFYLDHMSECWHSVTSKNTECQRQWKPLEETPYNRTIWYSEAVRDECKGLFDGDGCFQKEIRETCGAEKWEEFLSFVRHMNRIRWVCEYYFWKIKW
ncbi:unnamed protein product [Caenorhabditis brenneri]